MRVRIDIDCSGEAFQDIYMELKKILDKVPGKILGQLERSEQCICKELEEDDKLRDSNGNPVGFVGITK